MMNPAERKPAKTNPEPPPGWGADELTKFFDAARANQFATFFAKPGVVQKLIAIDALFVTVSKGWLNPNGVLAVFLLHRCHGAFRAAAGLAMAGQVAETYPACRAMLEFAAYAVHIHRNPTLSEIWLNRHQNGTSMKAQKTAFQHVKVAASVVGRIATPASVSRISISVRSISAATPTKERSPAA